MTLAEKHKIGHYMWDVSSVHRRILERNQKLDGKR